MNIPPMNATAFARLLGVAKSTVSGWMAAGMPHRPGRGKRPAQIVLAEALPWVLHHRMAPPGSERERLAKEQADRVALDNAVKRGELVYASHVDEIMATMSADLVALLEALPGRAAAPAAGKSAAEVRSILLDEVRRVRGAFAEAIGALAERIAQA